MSVAKFIELMRPGLDACPTHNYNYVTLLAIYTKYAYHGLNIEF